MRITSFAEDSFYPSDYISSRGSGIADAQSEHRTCITFAFLPVDIDSKLLGLSRSRGTSMWWALACCLVLQRQDILYRFVPHPIVC